MKIMKLLMIVMTMTMMAIRATLRQIFQAGHSRLSHALHEVTGDEQVAWDDPVGVFVSTSRCNAALHPSLITSRSLYRTTMIKRKYSSIKKKMNKKKSREKK